MRVRLLLVGVLSVVCALLVSGASALAFTKHVPSMSFGGVGSGAGQMMLTAASGASAGSGVAVDAGSGDVYVADTGNFRVDQFSSAGVFIRAWGWGVADGLPVFETCSLSCQQGVSGSGAGQFTSPVLVAVDNSGGPSAGDVYVGDAGDNRVSKFSSVGALIGGWGSGGQLDGSSTGAGPFASVAGIAVGSSGAGTLYVLSYLNAKLFEFEQDGAFVEELDVVRGSEPHGLAVDSAGNIFKVNGAPDVEEMTGAGGDVGQVSLEAQVSPAGLALGGGGDLYVAESGAVAHYVFTEPGVVGEADGSTCGFAPNSGCAATDSFGAGTLSGSGGIGVDLASDAVYVADVSAGKIDAFAPIVVPDIAIEPASEVGPQSARLQGSVNPDAIQVSDCRFEYGTETSYGQSAPCVPAPGAGSAPVAVHAEITNLQPGTTYHYRLVAANANGASHGSDQQVTTLPPPAIDAASATNVTAGSVDLSARIDPRGYDTTYHFEYGTDTGYGTSVPVPDTDIGAGMGDVAVTRHLSGLQANTTYHWRVVAHNSNGTANGLDHTFIYSTSGTTGLPDGRAYEMVTPPAKNGGAVGDVFLGLYPDVSESGSRVVMSSIQCFGDSTSCPADEGTVGTPYEFTRGGGGWSATALAPSATQFAVNNGFTSSADASSELFSMPTPPVGEDDWYARRADGSFQDIGPMTPPSAGILGQPLAEAPVRGTSDLSHLVYDSAPYWPFDQANGNEQFNSLYEYVGVSNTAPVLVGVSGGAGSTDLISKCGTGLGSAVRDEMYGALSGDGRTVFFTAVQCASGSGVNAGVEVPVREVFARIDESRTVAISQRSPLECTAPSGCLGSPAGAAWFVGASEDGSRAFFLDTQQLTDNASEDNHSGDTAYAAGCEHTAGVNGCNLYEYDFSAPAGRNLVAVSAGDSSGGGPRVQGVLAMSPDGSHVYFVAQGVLSAAGNDRGQTARVGADNLYLFERDAGHPEGQVSFITTLPAVDAVETPSQWTLGYFPANVTPDGRFLVFTSHGALTADDSNTTDGSQVFRYDAVTGRLVRVSVGEGGFNDNGNAGVGNAAIVLDLSKGLGYPRSDPTMSHDGSYVFFESPVALTPGALDDVPVGGVEPESPTGAEPAYAYNLYEWHEGHVSLLSDGRDTSATHAAYCRSHQSSVCLLGSDATGSNVFFTTSDPLVAADTDTGLDVYDARVCTTSDPCVAPGVAPVVACQGEACHGTPGPAPGVVGAATSTFSGPGNLAPPASASRRLSAKKAPLKCAKGKRAKSGRCVKTRKSKRAKAKRARAKRAKSTHGGKK